MVRSKRFDPQTLRSAINKSWQSHSHENPYPNANAKPNRIERVLILS